MNAPYTPTQRAELALSHSEEFCNMLAQAREFRYPGWWEGSAFRSHPCGMVVDTIKLTNHWHVDNLCTVEITDGTGWNTADVSKDSLSNFGDPHPRPIKGTALLVWRCGRWADAQYEQALRERLLAILTSLAEHIEKAAAQRAERERAQQAAQAEQRRQVTAAALAKASGGAA